jgi:hypothetical protein
VHKIILFVKLGTSIKEAYWKKEKLVLKEAVLNNSCPQINVIDANKYGWLFDSWSIFFIIQEFVWREK